MARRDLGREHGVALVVAVMAMAMMTALGAALMLTTMTETRIASSYAEGVGLRYAAEGALERVLADLQEAPEWSTLPTLYADGPLDQLLPGGSVMPGHRVRVTIARGEDEMTVVESRAFASAGAQRAIAVTIERINEAEGAAVRIVSWREVP